jgi:uncharacterized protein (TIGR02466 family)
MKKIKHNFWYTPVWEIEEAFSPKFNDELLQEIYSHISKHQVGDFNLWQSNGKRIRELHDFISTFVNENIKPEVCVDKEFNLKLSFACLNVQNNSQYFPMHHHFDTLASCVYYIQTPENCGDLLLVDPRGGVNWELMTDKEITPSPFGIKYKRIKPKVGKLVIFPSYVMHMVEPNNSGYQRLSLVTNVLM